RRCSRPISSSAPRRSSSARWSWPSGHASSSRRKQTSRPSWHVPRASFSGARPRSEARSTNAFVRLRVLTHAPRARETPAGRRRRCADPRGLSGDRPAREDRSSIIPRSLGCRGGESRLVLGRRGRGFADLIEVFKMDERFLAVLLTVSQEQMIKLGGRGTMYADEAIVAHSNLDEYDALVSEPRAAAL